MAFQIYLVTVNLTSWEFMSWMRITYLKVWPKKHGSPFNKGWLANVKLFIKINGRSNEDCHHWHMPTKLPALTK